MPNLKWKQWRKKKSSIESVTEIWERHITWPVIKALGTVPSDDYDTFNWATGHTMQPEFLILGLYFNFQYFYSNLKLLF